MPVVVGTDVTESGGGEGVGDRGEHPIAGGREVAGGESAGGLERGPILHLGGGGGADVAVEVDGEGEETEMRVTRDLITVLLDLPAFATRHDVGAVTHGRGHDRTVDRETGPELWMSLHPHVRRPASVRVKDLTAGAGGGPAGGRRAITDCGGEGIVAPLGVTSGLEAGEGVLTERVEVRPRTLPRTRTSR